jgi:hypothetical protein
LWAVRPSGRHAIEGSELGQYAAVWLQDPARAGADFPDVAAHLADGCPLCEQDLQQLLDWLRDERAGPGRNDGEPTA